MVNLIAMLLLTNGVSIAAGQLARCVLGGAEKVCV